CILPNPAPAPNWVRSVIFPAQPKSALVTLCPAGVPVIDWKKIVTPIAETTLQNQIQSARQALDAWTREIVQWHFNPETGCPFWLNYASKLDWDPRQEVQTYDDLDRFGFFQDEWLRGGPVRRWVPKAYANRPIYTFETGGSTGVPKSRINIDDF